MQREIRPGYKQTEVGVIPEDWDVIEAFDLEPFITSGSRGWAKYYADRGALFLRITNLSRTWLYPDLSDQKLVEVPELDTEGQRTSLQDGDILISITADIGVVGYVGPEVPKPAYINQHIACLRLPAKKTNSLFQSYYLASQDPQRRFMEMTDIGAKSGINLTTIGKLKLIQPPLPEQRAIATALADADGLIAALEGMIAKKRDLKQAAMQHLLTGKTRLPGFSGEWEMKRLGDACWFQEGPGVRNTQFTTSGVKLLNGTNIYRGLLNLETTGRFISVDEAYGAYIHFMADEGDIVLASSGITIERLHEKVAFVRACNLPFCMNTSTIRFKANSQDLSPDFLFHFLTSDEFKRPIGIQATGSAQLNFGPSHVAKVDIALPPLAEQTAIAEALSDMDADLVALEAQVAKARAVKQGMMQELLTGRVRLV